MPQKVASFYNKDTGQNYGVDINDTERMDKLSSEGFQTDWDGYTPKVSFGEDGRRVLANKESEVDNYYNSLVPNEDSYNNKVETIKSDFATRLQEEIDAIESSYESVYADARQRAAGNLGSTATINALGGQRGSNSGKANRDKTIRYNEAERNAIDARKAAEIAAIRRGYETKETEEIRHQETLKREDTDKWLEYMNGKETADKERKTNMLSDIMSTNINFENLDEDLQDEYASLYGYTLDEAQRSWNHKVGTQLDAKERADELARREDVEWQEGRMDRDQARVDVENELRSNGWEYIKSEDELKNIDTENYDVYAIKQVGAPDKLYKVPKGMSELELYEMKKRIDAKYKGGSGDDSSLSKDETAFFKDIDAALDDLSTGKRDWGSAWNSIVSKWSVPQDQYATIDNLLNKKKWGVEGAYEQQLADRKDIEMSLLEGFLNGGK